VRLQLIATLALLGSPAAAEAEGRAAGWISIYADDDGLTVVSPQLTLRAAPRGDLEVAVSYDVDVITAATADVVTAASPRGFEETRHGAGVGLSWRLDPRTSIGAGYAGSWEPDYRSHALTAQASREWLDRRLTTRLAASWAADAVGRAGDARDRWRPLATSAYAARAAWVFDRRTVGEVTYELQLLDGYQASPYRYVSIEWTGDTPGDLAVSEAVPTLRVRHALAVSVRRALTRRWFAAATQRSYRDSWQMVSYTAECELQRTLARERLLTGIAARGYWQSAAGFYEERYVAATGAIPAYRTADKMLAGSWSALIGARAQLEAGPRGPFERLRGVLKLEVYRQRFVDFGPLDTRRAVITSLGLVGEFR
jgi:hypothetical protein